MPSQRRRLVCDAFHHVTVAAQCVGVVVEQFEARAVVVRSHPLGSDRHSNAIADALSEWAGCRFNSCRFAELWMTSAGTMQLSEVLQYRGQRGPRENFAMMIGGFDA